MRYLILDTVLFLSFEHLYSPQIGIAEIKEGKKYRQQTKVPLLPIGGREAQRQTRWIKEALWIRKTPSCMNRDAGSYQLSHKWDQVISRSRAPSSCKQSRRDQE